jgi:glycosyltransferase involved in cell wall biosynthesis
MHILPVGGKPGYFANAVALRRIIRRERPTLLHAHYASGYGTLAALVHHRPTLLSVWGSDVYDFPYRTRLGGRLVRWNIRRADRVASTSHAMAAEVRRLAPEIGDISITPFGVDTSVFKPRTGPSSDPNVLTIGTVKSLADRYGVDTLIRAFALLCGDQSLATAGFTKQLRLRLVGDGPQRSELEQLVAQLGIGGLTEFVGRVPHRDVPERLNELDIYVAASRIESFGVAVIEASSCGLPVVVSDVGGLPEVVDPDVTGLIVPRDDDQALFGALRTLVLDGNLRGRMGVAGREFVRREYEWSASVDRMMDCYRSVIRDIRSR